VREREMKMYTKCWTENLKGRDNSKRLGVDEKIILKWIFRKWDGNVWTGCIWSGCGTDGGLL
jgi:hypothetical protein